MTRPRADAAKDELALSCLGSGRLGATALQDSQQRLVLSNGALPGGGLTRQQMDTFPLDPLVAGLVQNVARLARTTIGLFRR
ncbi:hypothetical protein GCM10011452_36250 [Gemmobacter lanyuensis]|uniref:Uncharacterized protein n=1 Tax=Gemmobacter lanyuensis TaxID=1054497 RepID=A0A918MQ39_9RHOB|nr:hypothetical protein [Gemmobacter lanyuensis]GGW44650.1 hypothetical protein GCM10011452_36250 [Gemmobacter lanyuensis]